MTENVTTIGRRIQVIREARGITRSVLAEVIGCHYRDILRWETSTHEPKVSTLKKIADALNVSLDYLAIEDESSEVLSKKNDARYERLRSMFLLRRMYNYW